MKILQRTIILLFFITLAVFCLTEISGRIFRDRNAPVIQCDSEVLEISVHDGSSALLRGVTATDDRDGDITPSVLVSNVTNLISSDTAKVTYIVFDSSDNAATASRRIRYTDYEKPQFFLSRPLVYSLGQTVSLLDRLSANDLIDGDITDDIRVTSTSLYTDEAGVYTITVQVTNSMGDTASLPLKVVIRSPGSTQQLITLSRYITYIEQGSYFDPSSYIVSVVNTSGGTVSASEVTVHSDVNTALPGNYSVSYTYISGNSTDTVYLAVVVK